METPEPIKAYCEHLKANVQQLSQELNNALRNPEPKTPDALRILLFSVWALLRYTEQMHLRREDYRWWLDKRDELLKELEKAME